MCRIDGSKDPLKQLGRGASKVDIFKPPGITFSAWIEYLVREREQEREGARESAGELSETTEAHL